MAQLDWKSTPVIMMDFEGGPVSGVVEYGWIRLEDGGIKEVETALCRPSGHISEQEAEVHGIRDADVGSRSPFKAYYEKFVELRRQGVFAAHNRFAENTFLKNVWPVPPVVPDWRRPGQAAQEWGPWIDTLSIYKALYPGLESYSLGELVQQFGIQDRLTELAGQYCPQKRSKAHCALYDAIASALLLIQLEDNEELKDRMSLEWLLQLSHGTSSQQELF
jgi:DNA polymerase-3 subunit epsilon